MTKQGNDTTVAYDSRKAWFRAFVFFWVAIAIGSFCGVSQQLLAPPIIDPDLLKHEPWRWATEIYLVIIIVGYGFIWPRGTLTHGRIFRPLACIGFGLFWGIAQAMIFLSIWTAVGWLGLDPLWTGVISYLGIALYTGLWHSLYWDIHVSPPHNIAAWNVRKVLFAHTPNLVFTLFYLSWFGSLWVVVAMQSLALILSCWFMHFPRPGDEGMPSPEATGSD